MGFRRAKSTQGNTNCQKNYFEDDQVPGHHPRALIAIDRNGFSQNERRRADLQNVASDFLNFAWRLSYDLSKFSNDFNPVFSTLKDHN